MTTILESWAVSLCVFSLTASCQKERPGRTSAVTKEIAQYLSTKPQVVNYQNYIGTSAPITFNGLRHYDLRSGSNMADIQVNLLHKVENYKVTISPKCGRKFRKIAKKYGANEKLSKFHQDLRYCQH
jgi:hypothetical protein